VKSQHKRGGSTQVCGYVPTNKRIGTRTLWVFDPPASWGNFPREASLSVRLSTVPPTATIPSGDKAVGKPTQRKRPTARERRARIITQLHEQSNASVIDLFAHHKAAGKVSEMTEQSRRLLYWGLIAVAIAMIGVAAFWRQIVG
jgi:hypothetical protein